jgi:hypothetical protein
MDRGRQKTDAELRKIEADKGRQRRGAIPRKRLHVLRNPEKLAFKGWKDVPEPWSYENCCDYIEWCHIGKVFPEERHNKHRRFTKANLKYCLDAEFKQRCIEVYQVLYNAATVLRNEVSYTICRMVWAEVKLKKVVDWRTLKGAQNITMPTERDIPRGVLKFPGGGLSIKRTQPEKPDEYETDDSDPDSDSDGGQPPRLSNNPAAVASRRMRMRKRGRDDEQLPPLHPPHLNIVNEIPGASNFPGAGSSAGAGANIVNEIPGASNFPGAGSNAGVGANIVNEIPGASSFSGAGSSAGAGNIAGANANQRLMAKYPHLNIINQILGNTPGASNFPGAGSSAGAGASNTPGANANQNPENPRDSMRMMEIRQNMGAFNPPPVTVTGELPLSINAITQWTSQLKQKEDEIQTLTLKMDALLKETADKTVTITEQRAEIDSLRLMLTESATANQAPQQGAPPAASDETDVPIDAVALDNIVENATYGLLETFPTPQSRRRANPLPPPPPTQQPLRIEETQDSLSFPPLDEIRQLQASNSELKNRIAALVEQYYQWKIACIHTVDRGRQMALAYMKIDNEYMIHNTRREFGLTSWAHTDDLFPWDPDHIPMKKMNNGISVIDWEKLGWDYEHEMSAHMFRDDPSNPSVKLWPRPSKFVTEGTECPICLLSFGPEGGFHLGTCEHIYHPMCLISFMVNRRRCALCKAPFHERLYELFGLTPYMPKSWELNPENAPEHPDKWGDDLVWSWRLSIHSHQKSNMSAELGWENDADQIVTVCEKLVGSGAKNEGKRNFFYQCFRGYWHAGEKRFQFGAHPQGYRWNEVGERIHHGLGDIPNNIAEDLQLSESEWIQRFKGEAVDYLVEVHSPETLETLKKLKDSDFLRAILEADGPARRTRSQTRRRLVLGDGEDNPPDMPVGRNDDEAGPSGTAHDTM